MSELVMTPALDKSPRPVFLLTAMAAPFVPIFFIFGRALTAGFSAQTSHGHPVLDNPATGLTSLLAVLVGAPAIGILSAMVSMLRRETLFSRGVLFWMLAPAITLMLTAFASTTLLRYFH